MFCQALRRDAALSDQAVIVIDALDIVAGRLAISLSEAIGAGLGRHVSPSVGREVLMDENCIVAVDGLTEAGDAGLAIADELAITVNHPTTKCRFVITGRDGAALRAMCRRLGRSNGYRMRPWGWRERDRSLQSIVPDDRVFHLRIALEDQLGAGANNPLLFSMAANLALSGSRPLLPAYVYRDCVDAMCERNGVEGSTLSVVLGIAFNDLIDQGIRTATRFDWELTFSAAVTELRKQTGIDLDGAELSSSAWLSGLITTVGFTGRVSAVHDSIAEFLAGASIARGLSPLPAPLERGTHDRMRFAVQMIDHIDDSWAMALATTAPLESAALSRLPESVLAADAPKIITQLLAVLAGSLFADDAVVVLGGQGDIRFARIDAGVAPGWTEESLIESARRGPTRQVRPGHLAAAIDIWSRLLKQALANPGLLGPGEIEWRSDPVVAVLAHCKAVDDAVARLVTELFSEPAHAAIKPYLPSPGIAFVIAQDEADIPIRYARGTGTYRHFETDGDAEVALQSSTSVRSLLSNHPEHEARRLVREALEKATSVRFGGVIRPGFDGCSSGWICQAALA